MIEWKRENIELVTRAFCKVADVEFSKVAKLLRTVITGMDKTPPIFEVMEILGKEICFERFIKACIEFIPETIAHSAQEPTTSSNQSKQTS